MNDVWVIDDTELTKAWQEGCEDAMTEYEDMLSHVKTWPEDENWKYCYVLGFLSTFAEYKHLIKQRF